MKELYTSPEVQLIRFVSEDGIATATNGNELKGEALFGSIAVQRGEDITLDF